MFLCVFFCSSRRRHTRCALVTGVQTCALPIYTALMRDVGVDPAPLSAAAENLRHEGASVMFLAVDGKLAGLIAVADPIKTSTPAAIAALHAAGLRKIGSAACRERVFQYV